MGQDVLIGGSGLGVQRLALGEDEFVGLFQRSQHGGVEILPTPGQSRSLLVMSAR